MTSLRRTAFIILAVAGSVVALVLVAVAIAVATVDVNSFAEPLAARVRTATGRPFVIDGPIALHLSLEPTLRIDNVTLGNAPWGRAPAMMKVARVEAQVALLPLLHRRFEVVRVTLVDPVINLETDREGRGNWAFGASATAPASEPAPAAAFGLGPALGVDEVEVRNGRINYRDGSSGETTPIVVEALTVRSGDPNAPITGEFRGSIRGVAVALKGNLGTRAALQAQQWPYPVGLVGTIAGRNATLESKVTAAPGSTRIEALALTFGELTVQGTVTVDRSGARPRYVVDLHMPRLVPEALALPAVAGASAKLPAPVETSHHVIPDHPLPLAFLRAADAEGTVLIDSVALPHGQSLSGVRLRFGRRAGRLDIVELGGSGLGGTVLVRGVVRALDDAAQGTALDLHAEARDVELKSVLALAGAPREVTGGRTRFTFDGKATGRSLQEWARSVDGTALLLVGPAQLRSPPGSSSATLDQLGGAINPFREAKGGTDLRCAVVRLPLHDGVAHVDRSIALETAELGVSATGTVDLRDETLDLSLRPQVRSGIPINVTGLADLVRVKGPFAHPQIAIDPAKSAETIARIGAAIGTGGWSLLGETLLNASAASDSPCAIALGIKSSASPAASAAAKPGAVPADLGKALGKLFGR
jgi:AsmA family protein